MVAALRARDVSHGAAVEDEVEQEADEHEVEQGSLFMGDRERRELVEVRPFRVVPR